ncbi:Ubiquitin thioesterase OTU1 [Trichinella pseudospiralis]
MLAEFYRVEQCTEKRVTDIGFSSFAVRALVGEKAKRKRQKCEIRQEVYYGIYLNSLQLESPQPQKLLKRSEAGQMESAANICKIAVLHGENSCNSSGGGGGGGVAVYIRRLRCLLRLPLLQLHQSYTLCLLDKAGRLYPRLLFFSAFRICCKLILHSTIEQTASAPCLCIAVRVRQ